MKPTNSRIDGRIHRRTSARTRPGLALAAPQGTYRHLRILGLEPSEAGNLAAFVRGIPPVATGWTVKEIDRLLFLRYLVERRRVA